jgi:serine/threonine protein phosphatase PrpC
MAITLDKPRFYLGVDSAGIEVFGIAGGTACAFTARAPEKETDNEDSLGLIPRGDQSGVLVVADGLGGLPSGEQASATAIRKVGGKVSDSCNTQMALREAILDGIEQANKTVMQQGAGAGTTIAAAGIEDNSVRPYHVGDSAILITGQRGKIKYLTIPHSPVGYAVEAGLIEADEAIYHEERHLVSNIIGSTEMRVEIGPKIRLAPLDTLVIASDGLFDNLQVGEIVDIIRTGPLHRAADNLVQTCRRRMTAFSETRPHKPDDLGLILFRPNRQSAPKPPGPG